jgi:16S rRNA (cytosine967-C5)-methyltransferase
MGVYRRPRPRHRPAPGAAGPRPAREADADAAKRDVARRSGNPRRAAYQVLAAVENREAYANLLLPKLLADRDITGRDAALATELAYGTLRGQGTYDAVLAACSDRPLDKLDPPVRQILRLGAHQLLATRIGAHAAVATSVDLAKQVVGPRVSGYVNAVLRRVATRDLDAWLAIVAPDPATDADGNLAVRYSYPRWIVGAYRAALGDAADAELEAALAEGNARPKVTMATLPGGPDRDQVMPPDAEPGRWSPYAFTLDSGNPAELIATGQAAVQDEASQLAAIALTAAPLAPAAAPTTPNAAAAPTTPNAAAAPHAAAPHAAATTGTATADGDGTGDATGDGERWLDLCAGPGGKSRLLYGLATIAAPHASLVAAELHPHRAALVKETLSRAGSKGAPAEVVVADGTKPPWPDGSFDRVLVDAPCSGLGALRRRPEARWRKAESDLAALTKLQRALLRSALAAVRPGGVVAYVTCSPVPAETRDVVTAVAGADPGVEILDAQAVLADVPGTDSAGPLFAQLWPHRHGTDAIFIALLRRTTN